MRARPRNPRILSHTHAHTCPHFPRNRHKLALYFNLTGIKWDYTKEGACGYISPPGDLPPRLLHVEPAKLPSAVALADALWAEVAEAHRLPARG